MPKRLDEFVLQANLKRRNLYLVLDDLSSGYSIRQMDLPVEFDPARSYFSDDLSFNTAIRIKQPPLAKRLPQAIFRFQAQRELTRCFTASFDSILAMLPVSIDPPGGHALNVHKWAGRYCPLQEPNPAYPIYIPAHRGSLFALADHSFEFLSKPKDDVESDDSESEEFESRLKLDPVKLVWNKLPDIPLPFHSRDVTSYAVHKEEQTLFVSTQDSTFVYNTMDVLLGATNGFQWDRLDATNNKKWDRHGNWVLPFIGRGHFDSDMKAWIGLSRDSIGHLCSCEVFSAYPKKADQSPTVKISKETFVLNNSHEKVLGATLISLGVQSYYCLLQSITADRKLEKQLQAQEQSMSVEPLEDLLRAVQNMERQSYVDELQVQEQSMSERLLRMWTFYVVYDKNGGLTVGDPQAQDYILPASVSEEFTKNPVGFWM